MTKDDKESLLLRIQLLLVGSMAGAAMAGKLNFDYLPELISDSIMPKIEEELNKVLKK